MIIAPNFRRPNVVAGFSMDFGTGLVPLLSKGLLFAQGLAFVIFLSTPAAPANQFSYLACNSIAGLYWTTNPDGTTAGDAVIGWVLTNGSSVIAVSHQSITNPDGTPGGIGGAGTGTVIVPPTPISGVASVGSGTVTWLPITFAPGADASFVVVATLQVLYRDATVGPTAHLTAALASGVASGTAVTLAVDVDLTGIVHAGDWILAGGEMIFVTADATSGGVPAERALGLTTAEAQAIGDPIYQLIPKLWSYSFPLDFFAPGGLGDQWGPTEAFPDADIELFNIVVYTIEGAESAEGPINYSQRSGLLAHARTGSVSLGAVGLTFAGDPFLY
ncbi:MAG TPA: hypothetical protein VHZ25_17725 [Acidobacteriaceae bacterium]|jgi:hypothetical protein|nr:hypothetical protein [Acidobacteriaceae bacterium]